MADIASIPKRGPNNGLGGRPKGATNLATREFKQFWALWFSSEEYLQNAKRRMLAGEANHLESYLLPLVYGKPKETIDLNVGRIEGEDLSSLSLEELTQRAVELTQLLQEAQEIDDALPAEYRIA
jgi:hypothetical protein